MHHPWLEAPSAKPKKGCTCSGLTGDIELAALEITMSASGASRAAVGSDTVCGNLGSIYRLIELCLEDARLPELCLDDDAVFIELLRMATGAV